jgi:hypothetical protein
MQGTPGFSGADLANLVNVAALKAARDKEAAVSQAALEYAKDRILMGVERKSAYITEESRRLTAYHEGGHALVAVLTKGASPVHKATIMPRGNALGMVMQLPDKDDKSMTRRQLLAMLDVCMGGRVAEEMIFGPENVTTGASQDLTSATKIAHAMVTEYGFSERVGPQRLTVRPFLRRRSCMRGGASRMRPPLCVLHSLQGCACAHSVQRCSTRAARCLLEPARLWRRRFRRWSSRHIRAPRRSSRPTKTSCTSSQLRFASARLCPANKYRSCLGCPGLPRDLRQPGLDRRLLGLRRREKCEHDQCGKCSMAARLQCDRSRLGAELDRSVFANVIFCTTYPMQPSGAFSHCSTSAKSIHP